MVRLALLSFFALCSLCTSQYVHPYMYQSTLPSMYMIPHGGSPDQLPQFQYVPPLEGLHFDAPINHHPGSFLPKEEPTDGPKTDMDKPTPKPGDQDKPTPKPGDQDKPTPKPGNQDKPLPGPQPVPQPEPQPVPVHPHFPWFPWFVWFHHFPQFPHFPPPFLPPPPPIIDLTPPHSAPVPMIQPHPMPTEPISPPGTLDVSKENADEPVVKATGTHQAMIREAETSDEDKENKKEEVKENVEDKENKKEEEVKENDEKKGEEDTASCWEQLNKVDKCVNDVFTAYSLRKFDEISPECCEAVNNISKECHEKTLGSFHDHFFVTSLKNQCAART